MNASYLFPNKYKKLGWVILVPSIIIGCISFFGDYTPSFLDAKVPSLFSNGIFEGNDWFKLVRTNLLDEIAGVALIVSGLLVAFSREKNEDEFISTIRLESLVWATYVNYAILLLAIIFVHDFPFFTVMVFNMFTILIIFIIRFYWRINQLKKSASYEE